MKVPYSSLKKFVPDLTQSPEEIADLLTLKSYEVDSVYNPGHSLHNVVVGHIQEIHPHPNADKLHITEVLVDNNEVLTIVCGAKNIEMGQKVAVARIGAVLPNGLAIQAVNLRGQDSHGMICSAKELGFDVDSQGVLILPTNAVIGKAVSEVLGLNDAIITIDNKGLGTRASDSSSLYGVAREVSLITNKSLQDLELGLIPKTHLDRHIKIETKGCSYYSLLGISGLSNYKFDSNVLSKGAYRVDLYVQTDTFKLDDSIHALLQLLNQPTHHPAVDLGNYILFEVGQPVHVFDAEKVKGNILIREAVEGETLLTLDDIDISLKEGDIVICDSEKIIALAGIIGGKSTAVDDGTTQVLIESAHFDADMIRKTARRLKLLTESAKRFERNIPVELGTIAIQRILHFIEQSKLQVMGYSSKGDPSSKPLTTDITYEYIRKYLGVDISDADINQYFSQLHIHVRKSMGSHHYHLTPPYWRLDLNTPEEYIEEIARLYGYDSIPATLEMGNMSVIPNPIFDLKRILTEGLVNMGYIEIITYPYVAQGNYQLINPVDDSKPYLRNNLTHSMSMAIESNQPYRDILKLFEISHVFTPDQHMHMSMSYWSKQGSSESNINQTYHDIIHLFLRLGFDINLFTLVSNDASTNIVYSDAIIGTIDSSVGVIEIDVTVLSEVLVSFSETYAPIPKYPAIKRDITISTEINTSSQEILNTIKLLVSPRCEYIGFKDIFETDTGINYTFHLEFRDREQSLTDKDINEEILHIEKHFKS